MPHDLTYWKEWAKTHFPTKSSSIPPQNNNTSSCSNDNIFFENLVLRVNDLHISIKFSTHCVQISRGQAERRLIFDILPTHWLTDPCGNVQFHNTWFSTVTSKMCCLYFLALKWNQMLHWFSELSQTVLLPRENHH